MTPGTLIGGKYRLSRQLGAGGMGVVWSAVNVAVSREVALKLILGSSEDLAHRLLREARACGSLRHRNIVEVYDVDRTAEGAPFLVMELLTGETLSELLKRQRRLDPAQAAGFARDVALALVAAHAAGIIHRDLKPANVFLHEEAGADERLVKIGKVLDFGVSKNNGAEAPDGLVTQTGALLGSPAYMSPEQARGSRDIDHRSDIWSLGVVLFEMLTGVRPFKGDPTQLQVAIHVEPIPLVSRFVRTVDPALVGIVSRCLERDVALRVQTAAELAELLKHHADGTAARTPVAVADPLRQSLAVERDPGPTSMGAAVVPAFESGRNPAVQPAPDVDESAATTRLDPHALARLFPRGVGASAPAAAAPVSARPPVAAPTFGAPAPPSTNAYAQTAPLAAAVALPPLASTERMSPVAGNRGLPPAAAFPGTVDATAPLSINPRTTVKMTPEEALGLHAATFPAAAARAASSDSAASSGAWAAVRGEGSAGVPATPPADVSSSTSTAGQLVAPRPAEPSALEEKTLRLAPSTPRRTLVLAAAAGILALAITLLALAYWRSRSSHGIETAAPVASASVATPVAPEASAAEVPVASGEPAPSASTSSTAGPTAPAGKPPQRSVAGPRTGGPKAPANKVQPVPKTPPFGGRIF
jgi:eukaryotic-like serine/threonine-protein kinase